MVSSSTSDDHRSAGRNGRPPARFQRNALAPGLIAAAVLLLGPLLLTGPRATVVLFVAATLALINAWFAVQAKQWWWLPVFAVIAVLWNPVYPFTFTGPWWTAAQPAAALAFLVSGILIKVPRSQAQ